MFKHDKKYYRDLIFFSKSENVLDEIDLELVFCIGNPELSDIWKYFKVMSLVLQLQVIVDSGL